MRTRKLFLIALLFSWGCSTISTKTTPTFIHLDTGKATNYTTMTIEEVRAFGPTSNHTFVLECEPDYSETEMLRCRPTDVGSKDSTAGVVTGLGSSVINSAAVIGGSYLIGKGLADSGDSFSDTSSDTYTGDNNSYDMNGDHNQIGDENYN